MPASAAPARLAEEIARHGPVRWSRLVEIGLYEPQAGFYERGGAAGRRADFLTSPEVGPLFGAVVARALDAWWDQLGRPDPYVVVDAGAGPGGLARAILAAEPRCLAALRLVLVERSAALRAGHGTHLPIEPAREAFATAAPDEDGDPRPTLLRGRGPVVVSVEALPAEPFVGVVLANELLDNLPFDLYEWDGSRWCEVRVGVEVGSHTGDEVVLVERLLPAAIVPAALRDVMPAGRGARAAAQAEAARWLAEALTRVERGRVVVVDYMATTTAMAERPWETWVRTYRSHERGSHPLDHLGDQDITVEVALDQLAAVRAPTTVSTQAAWLVHHGIEGLVDEGRRIWAEQAATGGLPAWKARSRIGEAEALLDPDGLGAFTVAEWAVGGG